MALSAAALPLTPSPAVSAVGVDYWSDDLNLWLDIAQEATVEEPALWASLIYMQYALNDNPQMIQAGDTWADLSPGYAHYYNADNDLCGCMFPTNYDTSARYDSLLICQGSDFTLTVSCSTDAPDFASYIQYNGFRSDSLSNEFTCISTGAYTGERYNFTVTCDGEYFTTTPWTITINGYALSYPVRFVLSDNYVNTTLPTYTPSISSSRMLINVCGNYSQIDFSGLDLGDIALHELYEPAVLHDYLVNTWIPAALAADPSLDLPPVPSDPTATTAATLPPVGVVTDESGQPVTAPAGAGDYEYSVSIPQFRTFTVPEPPEMTVPTSDSPALVGVYGILDRLLNSAGLVPFLVVACVIGALIVVARG